MPMVVCPNHHKVHLAIMDEIQGVVAFKIDMLPHKEDMEEVATERKNTVIKMATELERAVAIHMALFRRQVAPLVSMMLDLADMAASVEPTAVRQPPQT